MLQSIEFMKNKHLQSKSVHKGLGTTKVVFLLSTTPRNVGFTKENDVFIIKKKTKIFSRATKSAQALSITLDRSALERNWVFKFLVVWHLTMMLGFQVTWPTLDRVS
jgi:outer membrane lipoprotein-sorting protein